MSCRRPQVEGVAGRLGDDHRPFVGVSGSIAFRSSATWGAVDRQTMRSSRPVGDDLAMDMAGDHRDDLSRPSMSSRSRATQTKSGHRSARGSRWDRRMVERDQCRAVRRRVELCPQPGGAGLAEAAAVAAHFERVEGEDRERGSPRSHIG